MIVGRMEFFRTAVISIHYFGPFLEQDEAFRVWGMTGTCTFIDQVAVNPIILPWSHHIRSCETPSRQKSKSYPLEALRRLNIWSVRTGFSARGVEPAYSPRFYIEARNPCRSANRPEPTTPCRRQGYQPVAQWPEAGQNLKNRLQYFIFLIFFFHYRYFNYENPKFLRDLVEN